MITGPALLRACALALTALATSCTAVVVEEPRPLPPRPAPAEVCTQQYAPVCGERRGQTRTFGNACEARASGFRIDYPGTCRGRPGADRPGRPDRPDRPGWDRPGRPDRPGPSRPGFCTREYAPVCGQRGSRVQSFGNACEAELAGFDIVRRGRC